MPNGIFAKRARPVSVVEASFLLKHWASAMTLEPWIPGIYGTEVNRPLVRLRGTYLGGYGGAAEIDEIGVRLVNGRVS